MRIPAALSSPPPTSPGAAVAGRGDNAAFARLVGVTAEGAQAASAATYARPVGALIALQQAAPRPVDQRAAMRRASRLLDRLDQVRMALLDDTEDGSAWRELAATLAEEEPSTGPSALGDLLDAIELRVAVELAKRDVARGS